MVNSFRLALYLALVACTLSASAHDLALRQPIDDSLVQHGCRDFGRYYSAAGGYHLGKDYCSQGGNPVISPSFGEVVTALSAGNNHGLGHTVIIRVDVNRILDKGDLDDDNSLFLLFAHLQDVDVEVGQIVAMGEKIGTVGQTGSGSNDIDHLHFEIKASNTLGVPDGDQDYGYSESVPGDIGFFNPNTVLGNLDWQLIHADILGERADGRLEIEGDDLGDGGEIEISVENDVDDIHEVYQAANIQWTDERLEMGIYSQASQTRFGNMNKPIDFAMVNDDGAEFRRLGYPFTDIEIQEWYAEPATRSWKRGVIEGPSRSGYFMPSRRTTFPEALKVLAESRGIDVEECDDGEQPYGFLPAFDLEGLSPWFCRYYKAAQENGWLEGILENDPGRGRPDQEVMRRDVAYIASTSLELTEEFTESAFTDVPDDHVFLNEIERCRAAGVIEGYPDGSFRPDRPVIRAELVTMVERAYFPEDYRD